MRSKEVEEAIERIKLHKNMAQIKNDCFITNIINADILLAYIEELEEKAEGKILFARGNTKTPIIAKLIEEVNKEYLDKQVIRDKIKELEREKRILEDNKMKDKMVYTPYQIVNAEILRLKELLGE